MVRSYGCFATLLKEKVPGVRTIHCVLQRIHLVAEYVRNDLHNTLQLCIKLIDQISPTT